MRSRKGGRGKNTGNGWIDTSLTMGEIPYRLLMGIAAFGSLSKAARQINMPYPMAWVVLDRFEFALGLSLVRKKKGGASGGGSWLTGPGKRFVGQYEQFRTEALRALYELFRKYFTA